MDKSSKNLKREFLAKRRQTIAEMANKRRQQELLRGPGVSVASDTARPAPQISLPGAPPPPQN